MHDTAERVRRVRLRAGEIHRKRQDRLLRGLASLCVLLAFSLIATIGTVAGGGQGVTVPRLSGAMLLYEGAGGYVLAAVLSFAAGVIITVLCIRSRERAKKSHAERREKK